MIVSQQKPFEEILLALGDEKRIYLIGCGECATLCKTGGEEELETMKQSLERVGKIVIRARVLPTGCRLVDAKKEFWERKDMVSSADGFLVMSCGLGTQAIRMLTDKPVHTANDSLFGGVTIRSRHFFGFCLACGQCILEDTGAICPITRCPKSMLNGPCGGYTSQGKCEANPEADCGWIAIYNYFKKAGKIDLMEQVHAPKDWSRNIHPGFQVVER